MIINKPKIKRNKPNNDINGQIFIILNLFLIFELKLKMTLPIGDIKLLNSL